MSSDDKTDLSERIAVFRYGLISRLLPEDLDVQERRRVMRRITDTEHTIPGSTRTRVAEGTMR